MQQKKPTASDRLADVAASLNERQRLYLLTAYDEDQRREAAQRGPGSAPASTWRWIEYGAVGARVLDGCRWTLRQVLDRDGVVDEGTGATWAALEGRKLVQTKRVHTGLADARTLRPILSLMVRLTTDGRKVARLARGEPLAKPKTVRPLSLSALRLIAYGQQHPDDEFDWSAPWGSGPCPDFLVMRGVALGLVKRGLLAGDPPHRLKITPEGRALDVTAEPNWKPLRVRADLD